MSKQSSGLFKNTMGANEVVYRRLVSAIEKNDTSKVWEHIESTQPTYIGTELPRSFNIDTPQGKMWTHGNATEHMYEAITSIRNSAPLLINSNPNLYTQFILYDYWKALSKVVRKGIKYDQLISEGNWEFKFSPPREEGKNPVVKHAKFNGL